MWLLCYQSMLKFGLWNLDWWFRIFHFLKLTPFVKEGKGGCLIEFNQIFMLYILGWVFFCSIHYGQYFRLYNVYLCSKPSKTVGNFNTIIVCRQIEFWQKTKNLLIHCGKTFVRDHEFFVSVYSGHIYISSQTCVWKLTPRSLNFQIKQLLESKEFELALKLAVSMNNKYVLHMHVHVIINWRP